MASPVTSAVASRRLAARLCTVPALRAPCAAATPAVPRAPQLLSAQTRQQSSQTTPRFQPRQPPSSSTSVPSTRRGYRSYDHPHLPPPQDSFSSAEQAILSKAYDRIPEHGFTEHTILLGARDAGYPAISTAILPDGVFSLVRWHLVNQRNGLAAISADIYGKADPDNTQPLARAEILERAERLAWERLLANKPVVGRWQEALAIMAQPSYVPASLRELALLSDEIWALAGDASVDPTWYTKRGALSAIYASSELFMTTDAAPEFAATREFLRRRFHESQELGGYVRSVGQWFGFAASAGVNVLRSKGVPI